MSMRRERCVGAVVTGAVLLATLCSSACSSDSESPSGSPDGGSGGGNSGGATANGGSGTGAKSGTGGANSTGGKSGMGGSASGNGGSANGGSANGGSSSGGASTGGTASAGDLPKVGGCAVFTADDAWNRDVSKDAIDATWTTKLQNLVGANLKLHPDYGNSGTEHYGIPINVVPESQAKVAVEFQWYPDESDPGPYPFPPPGSAKIEGGTPDACDGDCHFIVVQQGTCALFEGYACGYDGGWHCGNGAKWNMKANSYGQRPKGWTSADAAGLSIMAGLVRVDEVRAGAINHAIRFTTECSRPNFVTPATHQAVPQDCDPSDPNSPPMGLRVRLNPDKFDISKLTPSARVVAVAMQKYGMILADNGSNFYFQGEDDSRWTEDDVEPLKTIPASAFEVLKPGALEN